MSNKNASKFCVSGAPLPRAPSSYILLAISFSSELYILHLVGFSVLRMLKYIPVKMRLKVDSSSLLSVSRSMEGFMGVRIFARGYFTSRLFLCLRETLLRSDKSFLFNSLSARKTMSSAFFSDKRLPKPCLVKTRRNLSRSWG